MSKPLGVVAFLAKISGSLAAEVVATQGHIRDARHSEVSGALQATLWGG